MNKTTNNNRIIAALATPYGKSAVAAIRISGNGCIKAVERFLSRGLETGKLAYNVFAFGSFKENLMAACFKAPRSYTGEDTVELYPHGNPVICDEIIKILVEHGDMALAERGEFTKRAFLNGKLDLMQCEALADIIDAETEQQLSYGNDRYDGHFTELKRAEQTLKNALSTVEAVLHYSDELENEEKEENVSTEVYDAIDAVITRLKKEIDGYSGGRIINDGMRIALIGAPNVGKSTILNALTGVDRAIVTPIAGTTRDTVDGEYVYKGRKFIVTDTAGLNETSDIVEGLGVERAKKVALDADAVVFVAANDNTEFKDTVISDRAVRIYVINKRDDKKDCGEHYENAQDKNDRLEISAKNGINITALKQKLYDSYPKQYGEICNHRQYGCAVRCLEACIAARNEGKKAQGLEIVAAALYEAYSAMCELYGEGDADENVITAVFERFCVGK